MTLHGNEIIALCATIARGKPSRSVRFADFLPVTVTA